MATVTFGGAYAVLAYVAQQGVENYHWLEPGEMLEGLGLAETTPGPLILVTQFVGFLAAYREADGGGCLIGRAIDDLGDFFTLLPMDFCGGSLGGKTAIKSSLLIGIGFHHDGCGRGHCKPGIVVCN